MTKLFCFVRGCNESEFGVEEPNQSHVDTHLREVHGLVITAANARYYKRRQNKAWQAQYDLLQTKRSRVSRRLKDEFAAFARDPSLPLPTDTRDEDLEIAWAALMDTTDDAEPEKEEESSKGADAKARSEWFGSGSGYAVSLRSRVFREQNAEDQANMILSSVSPPHGSVGHRHQGPRSVAALPNGNPYGTEEANTPLRKGDSPVVAKRA